MSFSHSQISIQHLNRLIAAMDPNYCYEESLRKKNENPDSLRGEFYKNLMTCKNIFEYSFIRNSNYTLEYDISEYSIYVDGDQYLEEDIPFDPPQYFEFGVTKTYAICFRNNPKYFSNVILVNFSNNEFNYVIGSIEDDGWSECNCRSDLSWVFSELRNVDFKDYYLNYPIILRDFIEDINVGVEKLIPYIKEFN